MIMAVIEPKTSETKTQEEIYKHDTQNSWTKEDEEDKPGFHPIQLLLLESGK